MKLNRLTVALAMTSTAVLAAPTLTISTTTTSRDFPLTADTPLVVPLTKDQYTLNVSGLSGACEAPDDQKVKFSQPIKLNCDRDTQLPLKIRFTGDYAFEYDQQANTITFKRQAKKSKKTEFKRSIPKVACDTFRAQPTAISVGNTFSDGTELFEVFSQQTVTVQDGHVTLTPSENSGGLVMLEEKNKPELTPEFNYKNSNIYFVMVDRFNNADLSNDNSYGRQRDGKDEVGTFHGGDLKGVIEKLDYIQSLGTDAIWLSPIVEQVHGFVGGGDSGSFPFYAYHGYWTRDFTKIDQNFGQEEDLKELVTQAHKRGIRVLLDAVVNHSGYATLADLQADNIEVVDTTAMPTKWANWQPNSDQSWHSYNDSIDYKSKNWASWWGADWVRAGLPGYPRPGSSDITMTLAGLPDFRTESDQFVTPPQWLLNNPGTRVSTRNDYTVSDYLVEWQADWVKRFGIDGFRVDTVKHVEGEVWQRLKQQASDNLEQWRQENQAGENRPDQPFWMMGEVWGHKVYRSPYYDDGFDALINFDMQKKLDKGAACFSQMAKTYQSYANTMEERTDVTPVSYMSSHDTELFFGRFKSFDMQRNAANALLLSPGAVQIYYGDEVARHVGPYADDFHQGTRSDMLWQLDEDREQLLQHWQTLGQFRQRHPAIGGGKHTVIKPSFPYSFSRTLGNDKVVIAYIGR